MANYELYCGDCLEIAANVIEDGTAALVFVDPPYNIGIFKKMPAGEYLEWCEKWIALCSRKLKPNGAFWVSHSKPDVLVDISRIIEKYGRKRINWVTWDKYNGNPFLQCAGSSMQGKTNCKNLRSFRPFEEFLIYHADEGEWTAQCDKERGFIFEPLRAYLAGERDRSGFINSEINAAWCKWRNVNSTSQTQKWFSRSCFNPPTQEAYVWLRNLFNCSKGNEYLRREYKYLRREYEDLRREFENLRYTFNNPGKISSIWQIPPAPKNGHPTPKPKELLQHIVLATSNEGDLVFDPMMGSGTTGVACGPLNRNFIGIDIKCEYVNMAHERISEAYRKPIQLGLMRDLT